MRHIYVFLKRKKVKSVSIGTHQLTSDSLTYFKHNIASYIKSCSVRLAQCVSTGEYVNGKVSFVLYII